MKRTLLAVAISGSLLVGAVSAGACSTPEDRAPTPTAPATAAKPPAASGSPAPSVTEPPTEPPAQPASTFTMPNLVGRVLQDAQDLLQSKGSYSIRQEDATGLDRFNLLDTNWRVCRQSPKAGAKVSVDDTVTVWSVKINPPEKCPAG